MALGLVEKIEIFNVPDGQLESIELPVSAHRVTVPADAAFVSLDRKGVIRVSFGVEKPIRVSGTQQVETDAAHWVSMLEGSRWLASGPMISTTPAVHVAPQPGGLLVDGRPQTREQLVAYLASTLRESPNKPIGVDPHPDCSVDEVLEVLEVIAFAPDFGLPVPRKALAVPMPVRERLDAEHGLPGSRVPIIGPVLERKPITVGTMVLRVASGTPYRLVEPMIEALRHARVPTVLFETAGDGTCRRCPPRRLPGGIPWSLEWEGKGRRLEDGRLRVQAIRQAPVREPGRRELQRIPRETVAYAVADTGNQ